MIKFIKRYIIAIILSLTAVLVIIIYLNQSKKKENIEYPQSDIVFSPAGNIEINQTSYELFRNINTNYFEKLLFNWQMFFDIFSHNPKLSVFKSSLEQNTLESIANKIKEPKYAFFKGSSDEILKEYGDVIKEECNYYNLDYRLILAIMKQESSFTSDAISRAGAYGFMQIMPGTGTSLENLLRLEDYKVPKNNIIAGIYYFAMLRGRYDGVGEDKIKFALAAYNAGAGRVEAAMGIVYFNKSDYKKWDNVKEAMKLLGKENDSLHQQIWNGPPPYGYFNNWQEPLNYVSNVIYYWEEYKKLYKKPKL